MLVQEMDTAPGMRPCVCRELRPEALGHAGMCCFLHGPGVGVPSGVKLPPSRVANLSCFVPPGMYRLPLTHQEHSISGFYGGQVAQSGLIGGY